MDLMLKYRNDRKAEGATAAELNIYDGKIQSLMSSGNQKKNELDMELLIYRRQRLSEGAFMSEIALIDKQIHTQFGTTPARIGDVIIRGADAKVEPSRVSVDFNNSTVGDLYTRAAAALGVGAGRLRLIFKGKHLENHDRSLTEIHLEPGDSIGFCMKLGCDGRCCDNYYNMLCDGMLKSAADMFKGLSSEDIEKIFVTFSKIKALGAVPEKKKEPRPEALCALVGEPEQKPALWASLLVSEYNKPEVFCEALSSTPLLPLLREKIIQEKPETMKHISPAESRSNSPQPPPPPQNTVVQSDDDLYG